MMADSNQMLEAILNEQRDTRAEIRRLHDIMSEVRTSVADHSARLARAERDITESATDRRSMRDKLYEYGMGAAVVAYVLFDQKPWAR